MDSALFVVLLAVTRAIQTAQTTEGILGWGGIVSKRLETGTAEHLILPSGRIGSHISEPMPAQFMILGLLFIN